MPLLNKEVKIIRNIVKERGTSAERGASRFTVLWFCSLLHFPEKQSEQLIYINSVTL